MPVGAMSVLIVTISSRVSLRRGMVAAMGVATADGIYALAAVLGGAALSRLITPAARYLETLAAIMLAFIAVRGIASAVRRYRSESRRPDVQTEPKSPWRIYAGKLTVTSRSGIPSADG